ncbi:MAG TPA: DUF1206 domain-containing protein [Longimicrobiales bacterium]|nr:DUF1206 domain-containing protein [Longimicrobiales bacterium]
MNRATHEAPRATAFTDPSRGGTSDGVELLARAGYTAKGIVYALIGGLAVQQALGNGGGTSGTREALRNVADAPWGTAMLSLVTLGLAGHVAWRWVQAFVDPEGRRSDGSDAKRWLTRAFHFLSGVVYALLAYYGATLVLGSGSAGSGGSDGGSGTWVAELMQMSLGVWMVGAVGAGIVIRGLMQFRKAYTESFREKIQTHGLDARQEKWATAAGQIGLTARGVVFGIVGVSVIRAAVVHDPQEARGLEGALEMLASSSWLLGALGAGLVAYGVYQWVKARYRLIGV